MFFLTRDEKNAHVLKLNEISDVINYAFQKVQIQPSEENDPMEDRNTKIIQSQGART